MKVQPSWVVEHTGVSVKKPHAAAAGIECAEADTVAAAVELNTQDAAAAGCIAAVGSAGDGARAAAGDDTVEAGAVEDR